MRRILRLVGGSLAAKSGREREAKWKSFVEEEERMKMIWKREETKPEEKRKRRVRMKMIWKREETKPEEKRKRRVRMKMIWRRRKLSQKIRGRGGRG